MKELNLDYMLKNGILIPKIGFGTWQISDGEVAYNTTLDALKVGYRHIDTAFAYGNEGSIGRAIKDSKIKREDIFITSKLPAHIKGYDITIEYFYKTITNLCVDYLDLYLIHAPWPWDEIGKECMAENIESWKAMIQLYNEGKIHSIGVSNFNRYEIDGLIAATNFVPHVNQISFFIGHRQEDTVNYCNEKEILVEAYSPLATGKILNNPEIIKMAEKYKVSPAQICIRYCLEKNTLPLPKSTNPGRIKENSEVDFAISKEDIEYLDTLENMF